MCRPRILLKFAKKCDIVHMSFEEVHFLEFELLTCQ